MVMVPTPKYAKTLQYTVWYIQKTYMLTGIQFVLVIGP